MYNKALGEKHGFLPDDEIKPREPKNKGIGKSSVKSAPLVNVQKEIKVGNDLMHRIFMNIQDIISRVSQKNMNFSKSAYGHFFPIFPGPLSQIIAFKSLWDIKHVNFEVSTKFNFHKY